MNLASTYNRRGGMHRILLTITAMFVLTAESHAGVIYQGGDPNLPSISWFSDADPLPVFQTTHEFADSFTLSPGSTTITDIHWWGLYGEPNQAGNGLVAVENSTVSPTDDFTVRIFADNAGTPDTLIQEYASVATTRSAHQTSWFEYSIDVAPLALSANTQYWLSVVNNTSADPLLGWAWMANINTPGPHVFRSSPSGSWCTSCTAQSSQLVFQLTDDSVQVPEPSTLALMAMGLAGVGFARKRTKA